MRKFLSKTKKLLLTATLAAGTLPTRLLKIFVTPNISGATDLT